MKNASTNREDQPQKRKRSPSGAAKYHHSPASHTGSASGCRNKTCSNKNCRGEIASFLNCCALRTTSNFGQPLRDSHSRFGRKTASASAAPIQIHFERNNLACPESSSPTTRANPNTNMLCLFSKPSPATNPNSSHSRGDAPLTMRMAIHAHKSQKSGSNAFIERKLSKARYAGANKIVVAARNCAKSPPPSSAAMRPVAYTTAAPAKIGSRRVAKSDLPSKCRANQATNAIKGGWST